MLRSPGLDSALGQESLTALLSGLYDSARRYAAAELAVVRADVAARVRRALQVLVALAVAGVLGLVGVMVLAQTAVVALSPYVGGDVLAGLIVGVGLLCLMGLLLWRVLRGNRGTGGSRSLALRTLEAAGEPHSEPPVSARELGARAQAARAQVEDGLEKVIDRLEQARPGMELLDALAGWSRVRGLVHAIMLRHPLIAGAATLGITWVLKLQRTGGNGMAKRVIAPKSRKSKTGEELADEEHSPRQPRPRARGTSSRGRFARK